MSKSQQSLFNPEPAPWVLDDDAERLTATVVFSEAPYGPFDYSVPDELRETTQIGMRLKVPLGRGNRSMIGYCIDLQSTTEPSKHRLKPIQSVLDERSLLSSAMLKMADWMSSYYLTPVGQVLEAIVPAGVRGKAGTREVTFLSVPTNVAARLTQLKLPKKQAEVLRIVAASPHPLPQNKIAELAACTSAPIQSLRKKNLLHADVRRIHQSQHDDGQVQRGSALELNSDQADALKTITEAVHSGEHKTLLVHGVTGSGKTEVYIQAIEEVIRFGRQAIVLVPEISLTPQTRNRFRSRFDSVAVLHSHLSAAERHWHWQRIADGDVQVVVGARSAIFAPTPHLGLIVLDEEHDHSFKQDSLPRYHARSVARKRAELEKIPMVLGSATPSLESWHDAKHDDNTTLISMPNRVLDLPLPDVAAIDLRTEFQNRSSRGAVSQPLHQAIGASLADDGQVILLLNRRGFSTSIQCPACGNVVTCKECDIALTHHKDGNKAVCHYCDFETVAPQRCPDCSFEGIRYAGLGTQRLEAEIKGRFPNVPCLRMDSDTMTKPGSHEEALAKFRKGDVKILLGTQMIAKGLDFPNVTLVGVINADTALHFPDFRAAERTFQLVTQVAGRTGRSERGGRVMVQTFSPDHPALLAAMRHDYVGFADMELPAREEFGYPPIGSMVRMIIRGPLESTTESFADHAADMFRDLADERDFECRVLGAAPAPVEKLRGKFRFHILLQSIDTAGLHDLVQTATKDLKAPSEVQWVLDVDPLDML